jgi:hypothetical protein
MDISSIASSVSSVPQFGDLLRDVGKPSRDGGDGQDGFIGAVDSKFQDADSKFVKSLLAIGHGAFSGLDFEFQAMQRKSLINAVSTLDGALIKSINRLEQING